MGETSSPSPIPAWMQAEIEEYDLQFKHPPRTVLDIGANVGAFTLRCLERWPNVRITAIEPMPETAAEFRRNLAGRENVVLWEVALRSFDAHDEILVGDRPVTCGFHQLGRQTTRTETVKCIDAGTLHSFEVVKIDTEGCELEILRRLNLSKTKALFIEYHRNGDAIEILDHIADHNLDHAEYELRLIEQKQLWQDGGILKFARPGVFETASASPASPTKQKLFVALPVYGALDVFFTQSLLKFVADPPVDIALRVNPGDSLVSRSRNSLTADFLASDCTHLLFIDTDLIFSPEHVARIMEHPEPIVAGFYPKKAEGEVAWVCNGCLEDQPVLASGLQEQRYMGTGFLRIAREVFERMIARWPELEYKPDHKDRVEHDFWSVGVYRAQPGDKGRYLSEDWFFCQRALDLGYRVWGDTRIILKHVGQAVYPLQSQQQQLFASPKAGEPARPADVNRPASAAEPQLSRDLVATAP